MIKVLPRDTGPIRYRANVLSELVELAGIEPATS
jgi:hypothetical protein